MLAFIYLAYQMMGLMYETVPAFKDTWIECLGDLARYRMAIEGDKDLHTLWSGVAATWYNLGSERQPSVGRLYHHLGILERPGIRKVFLYAKSLTSVEVFPGARDSLATFCRPIVKESNILQNVRSHSEATVVNFHAHAYFVFEHGNAEQLCAEAIACLEKMPAADLKQAGVFLIVTNIAALFEFSSHTNSLAEKFGSVVSQAIQSARPSTTATASGNNQPPVTNQVSLTSTSAPPIVYDFCYLTFNALISHQIDHRAVNHLLPSLHATLAWLYSVVVLQSRTSDCNTARALLGHSRFDWGSLASYLNKLMQTERLEGRTIQYARQGVFPTVQGNVKAQPLPEDYSLNGLVWMYFYFPQGWFDGEISEEERMKEDSNTHKLRVTRVQWLAVMLATQTNYLTFNSDTKQFSASNPASSSSAAYADEQGDAMDVSYSTDRTPESRSSVGFSEYSGSDDYVHVSSRH
jgi:hypothetical protein